MSQYLKGHDNDTENPIFENSGNLELRDVSSDIINGRDGEDIEPDYLPDPSDAANRPSRLFNVAGFIIVTEFCERLAYYGFAGSLVLFFQRRLDFSNEEADVNYSAWSGFCYVTPLLGAYIADTYLGRYKTILLFCSIYALGLLLVVLGSIPGEVNPGLFFPAIYIVGLGTGGIKPNVSTLGADQFDDRYSKDRKEKGSFFSWFYWSINLGSLISHTLVAYICQYGLPFLGGEDWGFFVGYLIPAIMMGVAIFVFTLGIPRYTKIQPTGSVLATASKIIYYSLWTCRNDPRPQTGHILDKALPNANGRASPFRPSEVRGVKSVVRLVPFLIALIPFWGAYAQMNTAFQNQGCQMDLSLGDINIPVNALTCFDTLSILILVPILDQIVYPYLEKKNIKLSMLKKISYGFISIIFAMLFASFVEFLRKENSYDAGNYYDKSARDNISPCADIDDYNPYKYQQWYAGNDDDEPLNCHMICSDLDTDGLLSLSCIECDDIRQMSKLSVFFQIFQFCFVGLAEVLATVTALEFFYSQAPATMRSVTQSLNLLTNALGNFLTIPLLLAVNSDANNKWVPDNLDEGHLEYYFILLGGIVLLSYFYLLYISKGYKYKTVADIKAEANDEEYETES